MIKCILHRGTIREGNDLNKIINETLPFLKTLYKEWDYNFHVQTTTGFRVYFRCMIYKDSE